MIYIFSRNCRKVPLSCSYFPKLDVDRIIKPKVGLLLREVTLQKSNKKPSLYLLNCAPAIFIVGDGVLVLDVVLCRDGVILGEDERGDARGVRLIQDSRGCYDERRGQFAYNEASKFN